MIQGCGRADMCHPIATQHLSLPPRWCWDHIAEDIRPVYAAPTEAAGQGTLRRNRCHLGFALSGDYPDVATRPECVRTVPGLRRRDPAGRLFDQRHRIDRCPLPAGNPRQGPFPDRTGRDECLYLVTRSLDPTGRGKARWAIRWKPALNAFAITFDSPITRPTGNQCQGRIQR